MSESRVAVLVDGDNVSARHSARILCEAEKMGRVDVLRVYTSAQRPSDWLKTPGYRVMHAGEGKNAADLLLSIDAMELALADGVEAFAIAASDRDYTHLAQRLRERGLHVLGLGEEKAPDAFRRACRAFLLLADAKSAGPPGPEAASEFDLKVRNMIARHSEKGRGIRIAELAPKMHAAHGTRISTFPEGNWRAYLSVRPTLYEIDPRGPEAMVRFLPGGFASD